MASRLEMSQAEYARHRGVSRQAVNQLVRDEKIQLVPSEDDPRRKIIDVAAADRALGEARERINSRDEAPPAPRGDYVPPGETAGLTKARTATEVYRARLAQLDYEEKVGRLLARDDVVRAMRLCAETIARDLEAIANAAPDLVAAFRHGDESGLRTALKQMVRRVQAAVADNLSSLTTPAAPSSGGAQVGLEGGNLRAANQ